jgi:hypothetical protein
MYIPHPLMGAIYGMTTWLRSPNTGLTRTLIKAHTGLAHARFNHRLACGPTSNTDYEAAGRPV